LSMYLGQKRLNHNPLMMTPQIQGSAKPWALRGSTFLVWALAAYSAVFWGLRLSRPTPSPSAEVVVAAAEAADPAVLPRFLGAPGGAAPAPSAPALAGRFSLTGVVADGHQWGAALLSVDGKPPRAFRVGAQVEPGVLLIAVERRRALLGPSERAPATLTLELPAVKP
jgi:general secretion pathway protein C